MILCNAQFNISVQPVQLGFIKKDWKDNINVFF